MKIAKTLLITGLLVVTASAVGAADRQDASNPTGTPAPRAVQADGNGGTVLASTGGACITADHPLVAANALESAAIEPAALACGSCSTGGCAGAPLGQTCISHGSRGSCNYYTGPLTCSTGGINCRCVTGPIP